MCTSYPAQPVSIPAAESEKGSVWITYSRANGILVKRIVSDAHHHGELVPSRLRRFLRNYGSTLWSYWFLGRKLNPCPAEVNTALCRFDPRYAVNRYICGRYTQLAESSQLVTARRKLEAVDDNGEGSAHIF